MRMDVEARMNLVMKDSLVAVGDVEIDHLITIHQVKVLALDPERKDWKIYLPRRQGTDGWVNAVSLDDKSLMKQIQEAVFSDIRDRNFGFSRDSIQVTARPCQDRYNSSFLGYADLCYKNVLHIPNVKVFQADGTVRLGWPNAQGRDGKIPLVGLQRGFPEEEIAGKVKEAFDALRSRTPAKEANKK